MAVFPPPDVDAALADPTVRTVDPSNGYIYDSTSPTWRVACAALPSCAAVQWPGYATTCIEAKIGGVDVVIQPWMGQCQQAFGRTNFPGGFGGEVGIYVRRPSNDLPDSRLLPAWARFVLQGMSLVGGNHLWWPDPNVQPQVEFTIVNPRSFGVRQSPPGECLLDQ